MICLFHTTDVLVSGKITSRPHNEVAATQDGPRQASLHASQISRHTGWQLQHTTGMLALAAANLKSASTSDTPFQPNMTWNTVAMEY
jgi:hypothetical protein